MAAPKGNQNARKERVFNNELRKALMKNDREAIKDIVEQLVTKARGGDKEVIFDIIDRIDGKATNYIEHTSDQTLTIRYEDEAILQRIGLNNLIGVEDVQEIPTH